MDSVKRLILLNPIRVSNGDKKLQGHIVNNPKRLARWISHPYLSGTIKTSHFG